MKKSLNILFSTYAGDIEGSTLSISYLCRGLAEKGHQVYLACRKETYLYQSLQDSKVQLIDLNFRSKRDRHAMDVLEKLILEKNIQVFNAQASRDRYISIWLRKLRRLPIKVVHTRRQRSDDVGGFFKQLLYIWGADHLVVISDALKRHFIKKGFPSRMIKVIYNGLPRDKFTYDQSRVDELKQAYNIGPEDVVIGCVSRKKSQGQLIAALRFLPASYIVIFVGVSRDEFSAEMHKHQPKQKLHFTGRIDPKDAMHYYKLFDCNVLASTMDGFGLVLVESMGMEVPVVATRSLGITNVVEDGVNGLLFKDGDIVELASKIQSVIGDKDLRHKLIENGKQTAFEKFSIEKTIENYEDFFYEISH